MSLPKLETSTNFWSQLFQMSTHRHRAAKSDGMTWVPEKNLKKHHEQKKKKAVDLNAIQQMAIKCRNNYFSHLVPRLERKGGKKNILICGKKVYCCQVKSRIFCGPFQNRLQHWELNILNQIIHFNWAKLYTMRSHFFSCNQYIYRIWCCLENPF